MLLVTGIVLCYIIAFREIGYSYNNVLAITILAFSNPRFRLNSYFPYSIFSLLWTMVYKQCEPKGDTFLNTLLMQAM